MAQSKDFPDAFYRVTVKGLLVRDGRLMMVEDSESLPIEWELPGGGLDFGESPQEALKCEIKEEMNLDVTHVANKPLYIWTRRRENRRNMTWFYILALCYPVEIEYERFTPTSSCLSIKFMSKDELRTHKTKIADQMHPLIDIFNPADFK